MDEQATSGKASVTVSSEYGEQEQPIIRDKRRIDPRTGAVRPGVAGAPARQPAQPAVRPATRPAGQPGARPSAPPLAEPGARPAARPTAQPTAQPAAQPTAQPGGPFAPPAGTAAAAETAADTLLAQLQAQVAERTADLQRLQAEYANYRRRVERDREAVRELARIGTLAALLPVLDDIGRARDHSELTGGFKLVAEALETTVTKLGLERFGDEGDAFDPRIHEALMHEFSPEVSEPTCVGILQPGYRVGERIVRPARVKVAEPEPYDPSGGDTVED